MVWRNSISFLAKRIPTQQISCTSSAAPVRCQSTIAAVNAQNSNLFARASNNVPQIISSTTLFQQRFMSKYLSKSATKRLPLTTKKAKKGYYKGNGATMEGRITSKGKFIADPMKKLQLVIPDLEGFKLKPYIASAVSKLPPEQRTDDMMV